MKIKRQDIIDVGSLSKEDRERLVKIYNIIKIGWIPPCHSKGKLYPECNNCPWRKHER